MIKLLGTGFPNCSQWYPEEQELIKNIQFQINKKFYDKHNLLVNTTWFGPQFENSDYNLFLEYTTKNKIDNLFLLAAVDPIFLNRNQTQELFKNSRAENLFLLGHFDSDNLYTFNFHNYVLPKYFKKYQDTDILPKSFDHLYVNYNRKPRYHRTNLVKLLQQHKLDSLGTITLGDELMIGETVDEIGAENQWWEEKYGIPHDIHSLGRLNIWQNHFLTVVSETEYEDFLFTFITEKTWKPVIGLRPFVINGQQAVYQWLRDRGFKTFNHYWPHIDLETCYVDNIHQNICELIKFLTTQDLSAMYNDMLPDLYYNQTRFYEFAQEQKNKIENLFL